jgi:hypothetical protein
MTHGAVLPAAAPAVEPAVLASLGHALAQAGYEHGRLEQAFGFERPLNPDPDELPFHRRVLAGGGRLATLVELFQLALAVERPAAEEVLAPAPLEGLVAGGLLAVRDGRVASTVALAPAEGLVVAADWEPEGSAPARPDHVLGVSARSLALSRLGVRRPVGRALDVGAGCGFQALLAAAHAASVVATDVNPRALRLTELNAALNGVGNVETRAGALFEPVAGERFDHVSCNPPYVVSPEAAYAFRDSGLPGDSFCEALVRGLPGVLADGGFAHALVSWAHGAAEDWSAPLHRWLDGSGCDALLLRVDSQAPLEYAAGWNRVLGLEPDAYEDALERWTRSFRELGIERIAWGALVLRRRAGGGRICAADLPHLEDAAAAGHHVERLLAAQELLAAVGGPPGLRRLPLALADDARLEQTIRVERGRGALERVALRLHGGLGLEVELDPATPGALTEIDAGRAPGVVLAEAAARLAPAGEWAAVADGATAALGRLVELGFLVPAETAG